MWDRRAKIIDVHDGDTIRVVLDQGFYDTKEISVRLLGTFAPELAQPGGIETRDFARQWVANQGAAPWPLIVTTTRLPRADHEDTSFSRYVATVTNADGTQSLNGAVEAYVKAHGYPGGTGS